MKERTWLGILLSFAAPCRGKMAGSVVLAILSVAGGFVPYLGVYQIIRLFLERQADWRALYFGAACVWPAMPSRWRDMPCPPCWPMYPPTQFWRACAFRWRTG